MKFLVSILSQIIFIAEKIYLRLLIFTEKKITVLYLIAFRNRFGNKTRIGRNVRIGVGCHFRTGRNTELIIGDNVLIGRNCQIFLNDNSRVMIKDNSYIGQNCEILIRYGLEIGEAALIAQRCIIIDYNHAWDSREGVKRKEFIGGPVRIGNNSWLGAGVIVLAGSNIGERSVVGAGSVVRGIVEPGTKKVEYR